MEEFLSNYYNTISNETILEKDIEQSLKDAMISDYQKLLSDQVAVCNVSKYEFKLSDMKQVTRVPGHDLQVSNIFRRAYQINEGLVKYDKRHIISTLGLMDKLLTQEDISNNKHNIFEKNYLCFINNYMVDCLDVVVADEYTTFILNLSGSETETTMSMATYEELISSDAIVTLYTVPNFYKETLSINRATLVDKLSGSISFDRLINPKVFDENTLFFINKTSEYSTKTLIECEVTDNSVDLLDTSDLTSIRYVLSIYKIPLFRFYDTFTEDGWFRLSEYKSPVPNSNMIPFVLKTSEDATVMRDIKIDKYYPDIYNITGIHTDDKVTLGLFYSDSSWTKHDNRLELLYRYIPEPLGLYETGEIPDFIKDYEPYDVPYYSDLYVDKVHMPYNFAYKINRFKEFIDNDYKYLISYLYNKLKGKMRHYIYMNKLDLTTRIRVDNGNECFPTPNVPFDVYRKDYTEVTFPEERYLFSLPKSILGPDEVFRFFIDNLAVMPNSYHLQADADWYHLYIPCSMITDNSILEIEKFPKYDTIIRISDDESKTGKFIFTKPKDIPRVYVNNLHIYNTDTFEYVPSEAYTITIKDKYTGEDIVVTNKSRASISDVAEINIIDDNYIGQPMSVAVKTYPRFYCNDDATELLYVNVYNDVEVGRDLIRPFVDGLFLTPHLFITDYDTETSGLYNGTLKVVVNTDLSNSDFMVDIMPSAMKMEYNKRGIFCDEIGFVDTGDSLSLPIDLKWYDIYVNGRKLNKSNIEIISPNKFFIKEIDSRKNIEIWLRGDAPLEFKFNQYDETIDDELFDDEKLREIIRDSKDLLEDSLADIYDEIVINFLAELDDFIDTFLRYSFINPNEQQLDEDVKFKYPDLFDEFDIMWLDSNTYTDADYLTFINSNERDDDMKNGQYRFGFTPMYIGSHDDALPGEYMCDPITGLPGVKDVNDQTILPGGNIQRLVCHRNSFASTLARNGFTGMTIYQLEFDENTTAKMVMNGVNILDAENFEVLSATDGELTPNKVCFSIDADVLEEGTNNVMRLSKYDPIVTVYYKYMKTEAMNEMVGALTSPLSALPESMLSILTSVVGENGLVVDNVCTGFIIDRIIISAQAGEEEIFESKKIILHSILIAF